jgi:hypothetical protein
MLEDNGLFTLNEATTARVMATISNATAARHGKEPTTKRAQTSLPGLPSRLVEAKQNTHPAVRTVR